MTTNIYVLKLEGENYYVGKSANVSERFQQHLSGIGSAWTKRFRPIGIEVIHENLSPFDEDRITKEYMAKYGIEKVRGGSYVTVTLSEETVATIQREIRTAQDSCLRCGRKGHFVTSCYAKTDGNGKSLKEEKPQSMVCMRCGRDGHTTEDCEYVTTITRKKIVDFGTPSKKHCTRCGRDTHTTDNCRCKTTVDGKKIVEEEQVQPTPKNCERCGRDTHTKDKCYAKTDVKGGKDR